MSIKTYVVILAGGGGGRLWPISRRERPKQLLQFKDKQSLLEKTLERIAPLAPLDQRIIVTAQDQAWQMQEAVGEHVGHIVMEPVAQNTAAAFTLAAYLIYKEDPTALVVFTPADHYVPQHEKFVHFIQHALDCAQHTKDLVLLGLTPHYPATGYGYISPKKTGTFPAPVEMFHEKPNEEQAQEFCAQGFLWNSGIVVAQAAVFLETVQEVAPDIYQGVYDYLEKDEPYEAIPARSVDYAVLEKAKNCSVLPADFVWCDVGNLETFLSLKDHEQDKSEKVISIDAHNNLVEVDTMLVALVGVSDICVVQNEDIVLVVHRSQVEKVKLVLEALRQERLQEYM